MERPLQWWQGEWPTTDRKESSTAPSYSHTPTSSSATVPGTNIAICLGPSGFERAAGLFWINASPFPSQDCHLSLVIANKSSSSSSSKRLVVFTSLAWLTVPAGFAGSSFWPCSEGGLAGLETFQCSLKRTNKFSFVLVKVTLQSSL